MYEYVQFTRWSMFANIVNGIDVRVTRCLPARQLIANKKDFCFEDGSSRILQNKYSFCVCVFYFQINQTSDSSGSASWCVLDDIPPSGCRYV